MHGYDSRMPSYTPTEIIDNYNDYADYEEQASASRARAFITWANRLLALPEEVRRNSNAMVYDKAVVLSQIQAARAYVLGSEQSIGTNVAFFSVENFRR